MALKKLPRLQGFSTFKPRLGKWGGTYVAPKPYAAKSTAPVYTGVRPTTPVGPVVNPKIPGTTQPIWAQVAGRGVVQPDYGSLINGDWEVQDAEAAMGSQMARARGDFQAGLRQQLIDLGLSDTTKLGNLSQYIDEDTIKAAVANKYSATAQNAQTAERSRSQNNAALAARGILSSGQTTKSQEDVTAGQEGANYSALRSFLEGGATGLSGLSDLEYNLSRGVAAARAAAAQRAAEQYPLLPNPRSSPYDPTDPSLQPTKSSTALSKGQFMRAHPRGNYYNYLRAWHRHAGLPWG